MISKIYPVICSNNLFELIFNYILAANILPHIQVLIAPRACDVESRLCISRNIFLQAIALMSYSNGEVIRATAGGFEIIQVLYEIC